MPKELGVSFATLAEILCGFMFMQRRHLLLWPIRWLCLVHANPRDFLMKQGLAKTIFLLFKFTWDRRIFQNLLHENTVIPWEIKYDHLHY